MILRPSKSSLPSVLIVDRSLESREVLRTILQRKGVQILETASAPTGLALLRDHQPGVVVLDLDAECADDREIRGQFDAESSEQDASLIVLGAARREESPTSDARFVAKPYHFGPLIRTIEQLLERSNAASSRG